MGVDTDPQADQAYTVGMGPALSTKLQNSPRSRTPLSKTILGKELLVFPYILFQILPYAYI